MWTYNLDTSDIPDAKVLSNGEINPNSVVSVQLRANESACVALAERLMVPSVESVRADVRVHRQFGQQSLILVTCDFTAHMHLTCGVTLESFATILQDTVVQNFSTKEIIPQDEEDQIPEYIKGHTLDLADIVAQLVALAIPPYPRAPEADLRAVEGIQTCHHQNQEKINPFAKLSDLKKRLQ